MPTAEPHPQPGAPSRQRPLKADPDPYQAVFDASPIPMLLCDVGTLRVLAANVAAAKLHGASPERLQGATLFELRRVSDLTSVMLKRAIGREVALGFGYHVRPDGTTFPVQLTVHPSELGGRPVWLCLLKSLEDVLTPREGEDQRRLLEAVGRITDGVAHDLNNLLSVILTFSHVATSHLSGPPLAHGDWSELRGAAERAAELTKQLLRLSRKAPGRPKPLQLNQLVTRLDQLLRRMLDERTQLVLDLAPDLEPILADAAEVEQLLVQLLAPLRKAERSGTLRIETRNVDLETERGLVGHGRLRVTDSRDALPPQVAALSAIVTSGHAWLESDTGSGAELVVCFPTVKGHKPGAGPSPRKARAETVLVVQDNVHLRKTLCNYFAREGFRVLDAESGWEALRCAERSANVDLLLTDFVLTDGSGGELSRALRERLPSLRVLVSIGNAEQRDALQLDQRTAIITKPFDLGEFGALVQRLLDQPDLS